MEEQYVASVQSEWSVPSIRSNLIQKYIAEGMHEIAAKLKVARMTERDINHLIQDELDLESVKIDTEFLDELMSL